MTDAKHSGEVLALTGIHTFLGRRIIQMFRRGTLGVTADVLVLLDLQAPDDALLDDPRCRYHRVDLTQPAATDELATLLSDAAATQLVHLAFLSQPHHDDAWAHEFEVIGTLQLLDAAARVPTLRKVLLKSHTVAFGAWPDNPAWLDEDAPVRGSARNRWVQDKVEVEQQAAAFAEQRDDVVLTVLRLCPMLGADVHNFMSRYLTRPVVPTVMGHDPLLQLLHQDDALEATRLALRGDHPGFFNIAPDGVVPLSRALSLLQRRSLPVPGPVAGRATGLLWAAQLAGLPPSFLDFFRYPCVAEGRRARDTLGFLPRFTTIDTVRDFGLSVLGLAPSSR